MPRLVLGLLWLCVAQPLSAQEGKPPARWKVLVESAEAGGGSVAYATMTPGWHVTSGPSAILYDSTWQVSGRYRLESTIYLFDPKGSDEGYGVFLTGEGLTGAEPSYLYFMLRRDGRYQIEHRAGKVTHHIVPWTEHPAILKHDGVSTDVKNVLAIDAGDRDVDFYVNGQKVVGLPREHVGANGTIGLRVGKGLSLHVAEFKVEAAPAKPTSPP